MFNQYLKNNNKADRLYPGILEADNPKKYFEILKEGGYATDPNYVESGMKKQLDMERLKADGVYDKCLMMKPYEEQIRITKKGRND